MDDVTGGDGGAGIDITDHGSLDRWFEAKGSQEAILLLSRNALRMFPLTVVFHENRPPELWQGPDYFRQSLLRSLLIQSLEAQGLATISPEALVAWHRRILDLSGSLQAATKIFPNADTLTRALGDALLIVADADGHLMMQEKADAPARPQAIMGVVAATDYFAGYEGPDLLLLESYVGAPVAIDAGAVDRTPDPRDLVKRKLWHGSQMPPDIRKAYDDLNSVYGFDGPEWSFWRDWYESFLVGKPLNWALQREVALIPEDNWNEEPKNLAGTIEKIVAKHKVRDALNDLPMADAPIAADRHGIGGNAPPEALEDATELVSQTAIIWAGAKALEKEAYAEKPDLARVLDAISLLQSGAASCAKWFGRKADLTVDTLIKWGVPAGAAHLLLNSQKVQSLVDAAIKWAGLL